MIWFWFAFLATAAYGSNLRAFLLSPEFPAPVETIPDMIASPLGWRMVVYGDAFEDEMAVHTPEVLDLRDDPPLPYNDFPFEVVGKEFFRNMHSSISCVLN